MNKLKKVFGKVLEFSSDIYVADYTNKTKSARGVEIKDEPFEDIKSFHLHNEHKISLIAVNFEEKENKSIFSSGDENCECLIRVKDCHKGWVLLCELKYCKEKNIVENTDKAYRQLKSTWDILVNEKIITKKRVKSYFNISIPEQVPFSSFSISQNDKLKWLRENKITLLGYNDVLVINEGILSVPRIEI